MTADDLVIALICGGGSALLPSPPAGLTLADEIAVNEALLASGAPISAMNAVRKHVSTIKGGRLAAAAYPAQVVSLVVSDIPGDNPALVASGPTVPDTSTREEAIQIVATYGMKLPARVMAHLQSPAADAPRPDDPRFSRNEVHLIASAAVSLEAAAMEARKHGLEAVILSDSMEGEARDVGAVHAAIAREVAARDRPFRKPVLILSGGETTVTLRAKGKGGRNSEFLLAFAIGIGGVPGIQRWRPILTASTGRRTMPAHLPMEPPLPACAPRESTPRRCLPETMRGPRSTLLTIYSCRGRRVRM